MEKVTLIVYCLKTWLEQETHLHWLEKLSGRMSVQARFAV